jgi:hypothetical protein
MTPAEFLARLRHAFGQQEPADYDSYNAEHRREEREQTTLNLLKGELGGRGFDRDQERRYKRQFFWFSLITLVVSVITMVAVIYYAWVAEGQRKEMVKATKQATIAAEAAVAQSKAALDANEITRQEQRAWLFPVLEEDPKFDFSNLAVIKLGMQNSGRSLATNVKFRILMLDFDGVPDNLPGIKESWTQTAVVVPNGTRTINLGLVPPAMQTLIATNKKTLIVWSHGTYTDRFNTAGEWYICRMYDHWLKRFSHCPENKTWGPDRAN